MYALKITSKRNVKIWNMHTYPEKANMQNHKTFPMTEMKHYSVIFFPTYIFVFFPNNILLQ